MGGSNVYLAGFSEGAQLTGYMQLVKLDFALGGTIVMDGFPLPPLFDMIGHSRADARRNATYYGNDMRWMIWHGTADAVFPVNFTINPWNGIFDALGVRSTLKVEHIEPGMSHTLIPSEFDQLVSFIGGTPSNHTAIKDYQCFLNQCYEKPGAGTMDKATCERTCSGPSPSPSPGQADYICYQGQCYEKQGQGTMDRESCTRTCHSFLESWV